MATYPSWLGTLLFGFRHAKSTGADVNDSDTLDFRSPLAAAYNSSTKRVDVTFSGTTVSAGSSVAIGTQTPAQYQESAWPSLPTTDGSTITLATVAVPTGHSATLLAHVKARIASAATWLDFVAEVGTYWRNLSGSVAFSGGGTGGRGVNYSLPWAQAVGVTNAGVLSPSTSITGASDDGTGLVKVGVSDSGSATAGDTVLIAGSFTSGGLVLNGSWIVSSVPDSTHVILADSVWTGAWTSGGLLTEQGGVTVAEAGSNLIIRATGIAPASWHQSRTVIAGDIRKSPGGVYLYTQNGTTSGSGTGPNTTSTNVSDGSAKVDYLGAGPGVPISWCACKVELITL